MSLDGYNRILHLLKRMQCEYEVLEHPPVLSMEDVNREFGYISKGMIKTIVFQDKPTGKFITVSLLGNKRVNKEKIALALNTSKSRIIYAPETEVIKLGFPLGGIAPFGFDASQPVHCFVDDEAYRYQEGWLYMGIGDNCKTLKLKISDFRHLTKNYTKYIGN